MTKVLAVGLLFAILGLAGCGQKGPLYLPGQSSHSKARTPGASDNTRAATQPTPGSGTAADPTNGDNPG